VAAPPLQPERATSITGELSTSVIPHNPTLSSAKPVKSSPETDNPAKEASLDLVHPLSQASLTQAQDMETKEEESEEISMFTSDEELNEHLSKMDDSIVKGQLDEAGDSGSPDEIKLPFVPIIKTRAQTAAAASSV